MVLLPRATYLLWEYLKDRVWYNNPRTTEAMKTDIRYGIDEYFLICVILMCVLHL